MEGREVRGFGGLERGRPLPEERECGWERVGVRVFGRERVGVGEEPGGAPTPAHSPTQSHTRSP